MIAVVVSRADRASEHIGEQLLALADWTDREDRSRPAADGGGTVRRLEGEDGGVAFELRTFDDLHLELENAAAAFGDDPAPDLLLFASRHSGETGPLLTCHFTGNFGPADYGGRPGELARACPNAQAALVEAFAERAPPAYDVGVECTHHGPSSVGVPSMFVELGSGDEQWDDPEGARAVAASILALEGVAPDRDRQLVGFGGGHYAPRFERIVRETAWTVGHVAADWQLEGMGDPAANRDVIERAFERSGASHAVLDGDDPDLAATIEDLGYRVVGETWIREVDDRPLPLVESLESDLSPVAEGLRFGDRGADVGAPAHSDGSADADDSADAYVVADLPAELLAEAQGIDPDAAREAVADAAVAFETEQAGTRAIGRAAFADPDDREALIASLADLLREKYDAVERVGDELVARQRGFDPEKASVLGVPEGPAFGRLAAGEAVEVDGKRIAPEDVESGRERRFPVGD